MPPPKSVLTVGTTFRHERTCDRYRPLFYAGASGDFNPIHVDPEVAEAAGLGGVILQGLCTMAWAAEAALQVAQDPGRIRRVRVRFSRPVKVEDTVRFEGTVTGLQANGRWTAEIKAANQRGEDVLKLAVVEGE